jgi:hypothetical protein
LQIKKTRVAFLGYAKITDGLWRVVDLTDGRKACVGPHYATEAELLGDFDRYAATWGKAEATVQVNVLLGNQVISEFAMGQISPEVVEGLVRQEFATQAEADAFLKGVEVGLGNLDSRVCTAEEAERILAHAEVEAG